ncbi:MAG: hypothetical protein FJ190_11675 [Gammaproteobacteria bacterium]|nr:hypothetical protein [Gammaproteobacteria bacterium]
MQGSFFKADSRADINGNWQAEVVYDWPNAKYAETFNFNGSGEELTGTASFLKVKRGILDGKVQDNKLEFVTKTAEVSGASVPEQESVHRYRGVINGDEISFSLQTSGGGSEHIPIEFRATRVE